MAARTGTAKISRIVASHLYNWRAVTRLNLPSTRGYGRIVALRVSSYAEGCRGDIHDAQQRAKQAARHVTIVRTPFVGNAVKMLNSFYFNGIALVMAGGYSQPCNSPDTYYGPSDD
jgi:hypothetical protein